MLSVAHAATGALIASKLPHSALYIPLAIAAHYLEDWIPHWDVGTGLTNGSRTKRTAFILEIFDLILTVTVIYFFWQNTQTTFQTDIWVGALAGLTPDLIGTPRIFLGWRLRILEPLNKFHESFHHSIPNIAVGLLPQVILLIVIKLLI
jgi:hypothetical protein